MSGRRILSDAQLEEMAELREQRGLPYRAIAEHFTAGGTPVHHKTIRWQCLRMNADLPPHLLHRSSPYVGRKFGRGRAFTAAEDRRLLELEAQGLSKAAIGRAIGRKPNSITGRLMTLARDDERRQA